MKAIAIVLLTIVAIGAKGQGQKSDIPEDVKYIEIEINAQGVYLDYGQTDAKSMGKRITNDEGVKFKTWNRMGILNYFADEWELVEVGVHSTMHIYYLKRKE